MKKLITFPNIQTVLLLTLSVAETVTMILYKPLAIWIILLIQGLSIVAIAEIRFAYRIAFLCNRWHSLWNRQNSSSEYDETSDLAVGIIKAIGYLMMFCLLFILFL